MQHLQTNTTLQGGKYRIERVLGQGGFGNTYVGINTTFDDKVAIKEFFMQGINGRDDATGAISVSLESNRNQFEEQLEKFKKEALRIRKLDNPHIVKVHDLFEENGTAYYVMDYVDGENLAERLKRTGKPMTEQDVREILPQILDALKTVHDAGIWHLDLKPANIMVDKNGCVKIIDFGASKQLNAQKGGATTSTAISYTNGFAPREQMEQNYDKFGPWTDIYALGATLYALLTNKRPPLPTDIDDDITSDKHIALPFSYGVSDEMKRLIRKMVHTNYRQRPQRINEIKNVLNNISGKVEESMVDEETIVVRPEYETKDNNITEKNESKQWSWEKNLVVFLLLLFVLIGGYYFFTNKNQSSNDTISANTDSIAQILDDIDTKQKEYVNVASLGNYNYVYSGNFVDNSGTYPVRLSFKCIDGLIKECVYHNVRVNKDIQMKVKEEEHGINFYAMDGKDYFSINLFSDKAPSKLYGKTIIGNKIMEVDLDLTNQADLMGEAYNEEVIEKTKMAYRQLLRDFSKDENVDCYYFLYDITEDGIPELWVVGGTCEADKMLYVYTHKDRVKKIFETGAGHSAFYQGNRYILQQIAHMGTAIWNKLYLVNGVIHEKEVYNENKPEGDYKEPTEQFAGMFSVNNMLPINSIK